jgi:hypothetical protein
MESKGTEIKKSRNKERNKEKKTKKVNDKTFSIHKSDV